MASTGGQTPDHLIAELEANPWSFDFFRAVRLLECLFPETARVGYSLNPARDPVRFAQEPSMAFAPSTLFAFKRDGKSPAPRLFVNHFGLLGPNGPLPLHFTEYARERQRHHGDRTIASFLNVFHHRLASFFYRAWADNQKVVDMDRYYLWKSERAENRSAPDSEPRFVRFIGSFFGVGMESLQEREDVQDFAKLYFSGRLATHVRNAEGLENLLAEYFGVKAEVQTFTGRWLNLPPDSICRLGESAETGRLGVNAIVGSRFWDCQLSFRIRFGPMKLKDYQRMLPGSRSFRRLKQWVLNYCGEHFQWDAQYVLEAAEVPPSQLGGTLGTRLGWTSWLKTQPVTKDADDLMLNPPKD